MSLKLSDLAVGDVLRSLQNQALWTVTEIRVGAAIAKNATHGGTTWIKSTTIQHFMKVDPNSGVVSAPNRATQSVRDHYDVNAGVLAVLDLLAERQDTPEHWAKAKERNYHKPYAISIRDLVKSQLDTQVNLLSVKQRDMIARAVKDVSDRLVKRNDTELLNVYADEKVPALKKPDGIEPGQRWRIGQEEFEIGPQDLPGRWTQVGAPSVFWTSEYLFEHGEFLGYSRSVVGRTRGKVVEPEKPKFRQRPPRFQTES